MTVAIIRCAEHPIDSTFVRFLNDSGIKTDLWVRKGSRRSDFQFVKEYPSVGMKDFPVFRIQIFASYFQDIISLFAVTYFRHDKYA